MDRRVLALDIAALGREDLNDLHGEGGGGGWRRRGLWIHKDVEEKKSRESWAVLAY